MRFKGYLAIKVVDTDDIQQAFRHFPILHTLAISFPETIRSCTGSFLQIVRNAYRFAGSNGTHVSKYVFIIYQIAIGAQLERPVVAILSRRNENNEMDNTLLCSLAWTKSRPMTLAPSALDPLSLPMHVDQSPTSWPSTRMPPWSWSETCNQILLLNHGKPCLVRRTHCDRQELPVTIKDLNFLMHQTFFHSQLCASWWICHQNVHTWNDLYQKLLPTKLDKIPTTAK